VTLESPVWTNYDNLELKLLFESPSTNGFDEMIKLTNEGKVWKFPIDNEQGKNFQT
jgi:small subunit ribosomal protein S31